MLLNYLNNIENINGSERAAPYRAHLAALDEQVKALDTLRRADMATITGIEIARWRAEMIACQEEFRHKEKAWYIEVAILHENQEAINEEIEKTRFELTANQATIDRARLTVTNTQAILEASQAKQKVELRRQAKLVLSHGQFQQEINIRSKTIEEARTQATQQLTINEEELHRQVLASMEVTRWAVITQTEASLKALRES